MTRKSASVLAALALLALGACADTDVPQSVGIDQDVNASLRGGGSTLFGIGQQSSAPWRASREP
ncbi:MAG TPA: hypothetical protein VEC75_03100 [Stellaceae bacterium]|nr:hypothetical protein [Stellaceae bacterium]HYC13206.1 hypothetical protein [Stellaceae bacterium]